MAQEGRLVEEAILVSFVLESLPSCATRAIMGSEPGSKQRHELM
jgi:hypothetical protein